MKGSRGKFSAIAVAIAAVAFVAATSYAQLIGGGPGSRLRRLREMKEGQNQQQVHYDPAVLTVGNSRDRVTAAFGEPNATQGEGAAREDVYAFKPDGSKWKEPQIDGKTIAAAVFTGGMSLAVKKARTTIQEEQLTLYHVHYDAQGKIASVKTMPPKIGSATPQKSPSNPAQ